MLVAGHETTASELAWAFSRLAREPRVLARLREEIAADDGDAYLTATINETLRRKPDAADSRAAAGEGALRGGRGDLPHRASAWR